MASPRRAESMFGWCRKSVQKELIELEYHVDLVPHFARRGRRALEAMFPALARASTGMLNEHSKADPKFQANLLDTRMTTTSERGKRVSPSAFALLAKRLQRLPPLPRCTVLIEPLPADLAPAG